VLSTSFHFFFCLSFVINLSFSIHRSSSSTDVILQFTQGEFRRSPTPRWQGLPDCSSSSEYSPIWSHNTFLVDWLQAELFSYLHSTQGCLVCDQPQPILHHRPTFQ
jgi:hypothetical protein